MSKAMQLGWYTTKVLGNDGRVFDLGAGDRVPGRDQGWIPRNAWTEPEEDPKP